MTMINNAQLDILAQLDAMRVQEATNASRGRCIIDYFQPQNSIPSANTTRTIDASCRTAMLDWLQTVRRSLSLHPTTIWHAMSLLDRYLSCSGGGSNTSSAPRKALQCAKTFRLAVVTCFYTAVKIYEPTTLRIDSVVDVCRGACPKHDIEEMELDVLQSLEWRVACPSPMDFATGLLDLLSDDDELPACVRERLMEDCLHRVDESVSDLYFMCCTPSTVGTACLANALWESDNALSLPRKQAIWARLTEVCNFELESEEVVRVRDHLRSQRRECKGLEMAVGVPKRVPSSAAPQRSKKDVATYRSVNHCRSSSPKSVMKAAQAA